MTNSLILCYFIPIEIIIFFDSEYFDYSELKNRVLFTDIDLLLYYTHNISTTEKCLAMRKQIMMNCKFSLPA